MKKKLWGFVKKVSPLLMKMSTKGEKKRELTVEKKVDDNLTKEVTGKKIKPIFLFVTPQSLPYSVPQKKIIWYRSKILNFGI